MPEEQLTFFPPQEAGPTQEKKAQGTDRAQKTERRGRDHNGYGVERALARMRMRDEKLAAVQGAAAPKPLVLKEKKEPKADWSPLTHKKINDETYSWIDWDDPSTTRHAEYLAEKMYDEDMNMQLLVMPPGTGKTAVAVKALALIQARSGEKLPFIITSTANVVGGLGWHYTIRWWNDCHPENTLEPILIESVDKMSNIIGYAKTLKRILMAGKGRKLYFVPDEVHKYKDPTSNRSKQTHKLLKFPNTRVLALTATPLTNDVVRDMSSYLIFAKFYRTWNDFTVKTGLKHVRDHMNRINPYDTEGRIKKRTWREYFHVTNQYSSITYEPDVDLSDLNMPDVRTTVLRTDHSGQLYEDLRSLQIVYEDRMFESFTDFAMEVIDRLHRDETRLSKMMEVIRRPETVQPLIFFINTEVRDIIIRHLEREGIHDYQIIDGKGNAFSKIDKERNAPILVQYVSGSEGVELKTSNTTIYFQNQTSISVLEQARGRNRRRAMQHAEVYHYHILSDNPMDVQWYETCMMRGERVESVSADAKAIAALDLPTENEMIAGLLPIIANYFDITEYE